MTVLATIAEIVAALFSIAWQLWAVAKAVTLLAAVLVVLDLIFDPKGKQRVGNLIANITGGALTVATPLVNALGGDLEAVCRSFLNAVETHGGGILKVLEEPVGAIFYDQTNIATTTLLKLGESNPDAAVLTAAAAIKQAAGFGIASAGVAAAFEAVFPEKLNVLDGVAPTLAKMAGFDEVVEAVRRPLYHNAFGKSLEYYYRSQFRPELPDEQDAVIWHSRRLLSDAQLRHVFKYSGLKLEYEEPYVASAYRAVQPRAIASAIQDTPFPTEQMRDLLQFAGLRDKDIELLLVVFKTNSVKNVRQQYVSALEHAAERGMLSEADLDSHLTTIDFSDQAKNYVHLTVALRRLDHLADLYRKQVTTLYTTGQLTDAQYVPALEAIGMQQAEAEAYYGDDSARIRGKALAAAERAAAREHAAELRETLAAARVRFLSGQSTAIELGATLVAAGLPAALIAGMLAHLEGEKLARRRDVHGVLLDELAAKLLTEQVAAIQTQALHKLITPAHALQELRTLGIPGDDAEALVSKWAAQADKMILPV